MPGDHLRRLCAELPDRRGSVQGSWQPHGDEFIRFEHVSFRYGADGTAGAEAFHGGGREECLSDISFAVKKGESLGIIGPTGCGKTTLINLLMRFYDAGSGASVR